MIKKGDRVKYRDLIGEVTDVLDEMVLVRLPDGQVYSLPYDSVTIEGAAVVAPTDMSVIMTAIKPYLKNVNFLSDLAMAMYNNGVGELHIKNGSVQVFSAKESLAERTARYKAEALIEAERKAKEDYDRENAVTA